MDFILKEKTLDGEEVSQGRSVKEVRIGVIGRTQIFSFLYRNDLLTSCVLMQLVPKSEIKSIQSPTRLVSTEGHTWFPKYRYW